MGHRRGCLARYGRTNRMEWFDFSPGLDGLLQRGVCVVIRTARGEELGEVLMVDGATSSAGSDVPGPGEGAEPADFRSRILRVADGADRRRAGLAEAIRPARFEECRHLLEDGRWPVELLDVEVLLDGTTTVVDLVKSDDFDLTALRAQFRDWFDFEAILEPAARENEAAIFIPADPAARKAATSGGCGSGGCGTSGGCGCGTTSAGGPRDAATSSRPEPARA